MTKLPEITGSEKQIAWATSIRKTAIDAIETFMAEKGIVLSAQQQEIYDFLRAQADAGFWIDNRASGDYAGGWLERAAKMYRAR